MAWTSPRTWAAGEKITAALLNTHLRDNLLAIGGSWTSYTPTLTQSGTVTKTVTYAKYLACGKLILGNVRLAATGAGTTNNPVLVGLPVASQTTTSLCVGSGDLVDSSAGLHYVGAAVLASTTTIGLVADGLATWVGNAPNFALASGDEIRIWFHYEAA
jgi:hypothetical protein